MKISPRRFQRQCALQVLYATEFEIAYDDDKLEKSFFMLNDIAEIGEIRTQYCWQLVKGVFDNQAQIDELITNFAQGWAFQRIAKIDLEILRIAIYEMLKLSEIPLKVSIEEAIELAKSFGDTKSYIFVNGILNAVANQVQNGRFTIIKQL